MRARNAVVVAAAVVVVAGIAGVSAAETCALPRPPRYITIDRDAVEVVQELVARDRIAAAEVGGDATAAVVEIDEDALDELAELMHERRDRCGGFMLHDSYEDAIAAPAAGLAPRPVEYTLDQGEAVRAMLPALDAERIRATIAELSAMKNRYYQSESGAAASAWLRDRWRSFVRNPDVTIELVDHGYAQKSVILTIPGAERPSEVVVLGGHLDSIALGGANARAPGADDDASGIATLTEVARVLLTSDVRPARTIKLMAYAAEEVGLRGSLSIVRDFRRRDVDVVGVMQLDMTNYQGSDRDIWLIDDFTDREQNKFVVQLIETYTDATWGVDKCGYACSDHASWHRSGYRASMPFEARSKQMNRTIHTAKDTLETSGNNAQHAVKFARLAAAYAIELAKLAPPPEAARIDAEAEAEAAQHLAYCARCAGRDSTVAWTLLSLLLLGAVIGVAALAIPRAPEPR